MLEIEKERAKQRQAEAGKSAAPGRPATAKDKTTLSEVSKGQSREAIGKKVGLGQVTAGKALTVKKAVDNLKAQGQAQEADKLGGKEETAAFAP